MLTENEDMTKLLELLQPELEKLGVSKKTFCTAVQNVLIVQLEEVKQEADSEPSFEKRVQMLMLIGMVEGMIQEIGNQISQMSDE